jgi:HAMP domain-containing protein
MSIVQTVKQSLSAKMAIKLAILLLVLMVGAAIAITTSQTRQMEESTLEQARLTATLAARQYGDMFDNAIDSGLLSVNDVFDTNYVEIKGWNWGSKPKYHTRYDSVTDRSVLVFQDKILEHEEYAYATAVDVNGYLPTHNSIYQKALTGDPEKDLGGNRTKRIFFNNDTEKNRSKNTEPFLLQVYHRDTGETMWDASAPIWAKGRHWGAFVLGVSMKKLDARKQALIFSLTGIFALFAVLTIGAIFLLVRQAMRPVVALTEAADQISMGEGLETPIKSDEVDEIGVLTKSIDRLRASMKAALSRLDA